MTTTLEKDPTLATLREFGGTANQTICMDVETNARLHALCDSDPNIRSISSYVCDLIKKDLDQKGLKLSQCHNARHTKRALSRFDLVKHTILPKLYALVGEGTFEYRHFCKYMAEAPISVSRECVIKDYLHRLVALGYVYPYIDENNEDCVKNELTPDTKFLLSGEIIAAEGKLEGLQ